MNAFDILTFGPTVVDAFARLKGRRAIEGMAAHKELVELYQGIVEQKNELIKEHGTDGAIKPEDEGWPKFLEDYQEMGDTEIDVKSKFQFTEDDIEKLDLDLATIQSLQRLGYYP
jgi:hypothetical protein